MNRSGFIQAGTKQSQAKTLDRAGALRVLALIAKVLYFRNILRVRTISEEKRANFVRRVVLLFAENKPCYPTYSS